MRIKAFDYLRAIAALGVVSIHVTAGFPLDDMLPFIGNQWVRFCVPFFIILSGFALFYSDRSRDQESVIPKMSSRLTKIILPYFFWTFVYVTFATQGAWKKSTDEFYISMMNSIDRFIHGTGYYHTYFFIIVIELYLLYPLLRIILEKFPKALFAGTLAISLGFQTLEYLLQLSAINYTRLPYTTAEHFPMWIFYFVFGMFIARDINKFSNFTKNRFGLVALTWVLSLGLLMLDAKLTNQLVATVRPSTMLYSITTLYFLFAVFQKIESKSYLWLRGLEWLSINSFVIFLIHPYIISKLVIYSYSHPAYWKGTSGMIALYITTLGISAICAYIFNLLPISTLLGGVPHVDKKKIDIPAQLN